MDQFSTAEKTMLSCSSEDNLYPFINQTPTDSDHQMSKSDQQTLPSYSSLLADPFFEDDDLFLNYFLTRQHLLAGNTSENPTETSIAASNIAADTNNESSKVTEIEKDISAKSSSKGKGTNVKQTIRRKRSGKDRHSKICTAQGTRDRRIRLSLPIARKFFYLQDLLGFDKASKTIEWLFSKSRAAIKELEQNILKMKKYTMVVAKSLSSTTESEVVSGAGEAAESTGFKEFTEEKFAGCVKEKKSRKVHKVAKESRVMARARARVRAREKMILKGVEVSSKEGSQVKPSGETYIGNQEMSDTLKAIPSGDDANNHDFLEHHMNSVNINQKDLHCLLSPSSALKISHEDPSGGNSEDDFFQSFTRNWEIDFGLVEMQSPYCTVPQMKTLLAANDQGQIPISVISSYRQAESISLCKSTCSFQEGNHTAI